MAIPKGMKKPTAAIIFSNPIEKSSWGKDFAQFLGGRLVLGEYCKANLIGWEKKENQGTIVYEEDKSTIKICESGILFSSRTKIPDRKELCYTSFDSISDCQMIIICVDPTDSSDCAKAVNKKMDRNADFCVISLQFGVKNFQFIEPCFRDRKKLPVLDGAVGCVVGKDAERNTLWNSNKGALVLQRLSKETAENGQKFINLMETTDIPILYRQSVTQHTWGVMIYNLFQPLCALTGLAPAQLLIDFRMRLVYAQMISEVLRALRKASAKGSSKWEPDGWSCIGTLLSLYSFEQILALPTLLFLPMSWMFLCMKWGVKCAMQDDYSNGKQTQLNWHLKELLDVSEKYNSPAPLTTKMMEIMSEEISKARGHKVQIPPFTPKMLYQRLDSPTKSRTKLLSRLTKWLALAGLAAIAFYLVS